MSTLRTLVVDDSATARRLISHILGEHPQVHVVDAVASGEDALEVARRQPIDLVLLDHHMPGMSGMDTLRRLQEASPDTVVLMLSGQGAARSPLAVEAFREGARAWLPKPSGGPEALKRMLHGECDQIVLSRARKQAPRRRAAPSLPAVLAIGASTGGPDALTQLISSLPADLPVPVVVVQHMPPRFTTMLAERLDRASELTVREAQDGDRLAPGGVWLAPGGFHLELAGPGDALTVRLSDAPPVQGCRPAVDVMLRSLARADVGPVEVVILTGMGADGADGVAALQPFRAHTIVQDEASSVVWGMPSAVVRGGVADRILPLDQIASALRGRLAHRRTAP